MKKIFLGIFAFCMLITASGCSDSGREILGGFVKNTEIKSYTETQSFNLDINSEFDKNEYSAFNIQSFFNALNDFSLSSKSEVSEINGITKGKSEISISAPDTLLNFNLYQDGENVTAYIPTLVRSFLPYEYEDARYVTFDSVDADFVKTARKFAPDIVKYFSKIVSYLDDGNTIKKNGNIYTMTLYDESVKNILKGIITEYYENPDMQKDINNTLLLLTTYINSGSEEVRFNIPDFSEEAYESDMQELSLLDNIKIVGEDGINIVFTMDNKGYLTSYSLNGTFVFDGGNIYTPDQTEDDDKAVLFTVNYEWSIENINKNLNIQIPEFSTENRIGIKKWIELYSSEYEIPYEYVEENPNYKYNVPLPAEDGSITFFDNSNIKVDFDIAPIIKDGVTYVADSEISKLLVWEKLVTVPFETGYRLHINYDDRDAILLYPDDNRLYQRDYMITINNAPFVENGVLYLPLKDFLSIAYNIDVLWNENGRAITLSY